MEGEREKEEKGEREGGMLREERDERVSWRWKRSKEEVVMDAGDRGSTKEMV